MAKGWLRLWIFLSIIYLAIVSTIGALAYIEGQKTLPITTKLSIDLLLRSQVREAEQSGDLRKALETLRMLAKGTDVIRREAYTDIPDTEIITKAKLRLAEAADVDGVAKLEAAATEESRTMNQKILLRYTLAWLIPVTTALLLGIGIGWVRQGFKSAEA